MKIQSQAEGRRQPVHVGRWAAGGGGGGGKTLRYCARPEELERFIPVKTIAIAHPGSVARGAAAGGARQGANSKRGGHGECLSGKKGENVQNEGPGIRL